MTGQSTDITEVPKSSLVNQWLLLVFPTRVWMKGHLQMHKGLKVSCIFKTHPSIGDSLQNLGHWNALHNCRQLHRWGCPAQVPQVVWASSRQVVRPQRLLCFLACRTVVAVYIFLGEARVLGNLIIFPDFLKLFWNICLLSFFLQNIYLTVHLFVMYLF